MTELHKLKDAFMLVNKHGDVVMAAPGASRREAWFNVRKLYGAYATLQYKKRGYMPEPIQIMVKQRSDWRWG